MHELLLAVFVLVVLRCLCASIETFVSMSRKTVAVVRCKDCKYGDWDDKDADALMCLKTKDGYWMKGSDFCSFGERRVDRD